MMTITPDATAAGSSPLLSIVIPAYNVAPYVRAAIDSALAQSYRNIEVIVVNDGSTDDTPKILACAVTETGDPRLRIVMRRNGGLSATRNTGIETSSGQFIGFLDADDIWLPEKAQKQMTLMLNDPSIGISFSASEYLREDGTRTASVLSVDRLRPSLHDMIRRNHVGNGSTAIIRRACFEFAGTFREELRSCEDYEMWCRILQLTEFRAVGLIEPLTLYRLREGSLTSNIKGFLQSADLAISLMRETMGNVPSSVMRAGHAGHYRIAAYRAVRAGNPAIAWRLLRQTLSIWPWLLLSDWRVAGTVAKLLSPSQLRREFGHPGSTR